MYRTARADDFRSVEAGDKYNLIDASTHTVRDSQFCSNHVRGRWCTVRNRDAMEYMADLSMRYGAKMCLWLAADGMTRTPLIIDALTALYGKNWRHVLDGCDRNH